MSRNKHGSLLARLIIAVIIAACLGVSLFFSDRIEAALGWNQNEEPTLLPSGGELKVHFIDVGQGDSCVIELPDERTMIIDGGDVDAADELLSYIDGNIFEGRDGKFDYAILTHADADHCGSLDDVLNRYPAEVFYRPNQRASRTGFSDPGEADLYGEGKNDKYSVSTVVYKDVIEAAYLHCDEVIVTDATDATQNLITPEGIADGEAGYYQINFYTPTRDSYNDKNNYSPIMILEYAGKRIALSGDAEKENENEFVELAELGKGKFSVFDENYSVDVIKLGHHGSDTSSSRAYLDTLTTPASCAALIAVISCGENNKYGHPKPAVLDRLDDMGVKNENIYRTDLLGNIVISVTVVDGVASLAANGNIVVAVPNPNYTIRWKTVAIALICADFAILVILPEIVTVSVKSKKKRR